ncbi:MAG: hypothetical protein CMD29_00820 [Flavobacteriales bacterium]|nr:hypothetical protein [Flavobacteriales bacterium]
MKNISLIFLILIPNIIFSQLDYGLKFGVNLNNSSDISIISQDFDPNISKKDYDGYNIGGFISLQGLLMDLRGELQYVKIKNSNDLVQDRIEIPITLGYKVLPFLSLFVGPSFHYVLDEKSSTFLLNNIEDRTTMGLNIGTRLYIGKIQFDLRYERGLNEIETKIINENNLDVARIDSRKSLVSFGVSYKIN